jgi:peptidoglycan/LPS O-acetylase OafA/YrhL
MPTTFGHANNYNLMRLMFALAVIVSHSFALLGYAEPVFWGRTLGTVAVHGFFVLSGFLITDSYLRNPSILRFSMNRALRIVPALLVALVAAKIAWSLCGGFKANPVPYISNGPIWTLTWEVICYSLVVLLGLIGVLTPSGMPVVFFVSWVLFLINLHDTSATYAMIMPMMMMFQAGAFIRVARNRVNLRAMAGPSVILLAVFSTAAIYDPLLAFVREHIVFLWGPDVSNFDLRAIVYLAALPFLIVFLGDVKPALSFKDDISYGVYVFGWPASQIIIHIFRVQGWQIDQLRLLLLTLAVVIPVSWASWKLVEQPFLRLKKRGNAAQVIQGHEAS